MKAELCRIFDNSEIIRAANESFKMWVPKVLKYGEEKGLAAISELESILSDEDMHHDEMGMLLDMHFMFGTDCQNLYTTEIY